MVAQPMIHHLRLFLRPEFVVVFTGPVDVFFRDLAMRLTTCNSQDSTKKVNKLLVLNFDSR